MNYDRTYRFLFDLSKLLPHIVSTLIMFQEETLEMHGFLARLSFDRADETING